jgi:hypothetical protein
MFQSDDRPRNRLFPVETSFPSTSSLLGASALFSDPSSTVRHRIDSEEVDD